MGLHQFLYLNSSNSMLYFPQNKPNDFYITMLNPLLFKSMSLCAVIAFQYYDLFPPNETPFNSIDMYVCSNICQHSFISDMLPVLTRMHIKVNNDDTVKEFQIINPTYVPIGQHFASNNCDDLHIYIKNADGKHISLLKGPTKLTLHLNT
jgi:hypothetical protein